MEVKYNRKSDASHIKIFATSKAAPINYDSNASIRVPYKKNTSTGALTSQK